MFKATLRAILLREEIRYPFYRRWCGLQCPRGWVRKTSHPPGFHPQITSP